eukprot:scaffold1035_cov265-Chaetoceros_neogracile.AAC.12
MPLGPLYLPNDPSGLKLLQELVSNLSEDQRTSLLALDGISLLDKIWTNGHCLIDHDVDPLGVGTRKELGIYLKCARLNHCCQPNAARASDKDDIMSIVSQKPIAAGEEITISYMDDNLAVTADRESQMQSKIYVGKFWEGCRCHLCTSPEEVKKVSDARRRRLTYYRDELLQGTMSKEVLVTEFLSLMEVEGLPNSLMGTAATMKMVNLLFGIDMRTASQNTLDSISFDKGTRVVLHKLKARPELNGKTGFVVHPLNSKANGRVGVLLDFVEDTSKPIALKPENLCLIRDGNR